MPEIAEIARTVHYLRQHLLNKTFKKVSASPDDIVFGKVGTSAGEVEKALTGRKVIDVGQQGKYFWMIMDKPPHPVMHFGMTGWFRFKGVQTYYYKGKEGTDGTEEWPPKYWKFHVLAEGDKETVEAAFIDARRLARIRLVDCDGKEIRKNSPLKENGPDPVIDKHIFTVDWLREKCQKKKVPIKAMLLDQANISGIGNWVADEVMYHSKIHPEQYANTLQDEQVVQLHKSIKYVCETACDLLADSDKFPEDWLFKHRWGKGKWKQTPKLPNGEKIVFLTVGGRTSAVVPSVQKKTGPVAKDVDEADEDENSEAEEKVTKKNTSTKKRKSNDEEDDDKKTTKKESSTKKGMVTENDEDEKVTKKKPSVKKRKVADDEEIEEAAPAPKKATKATKAKKGKPNGVKEEPEPEEKVEVQAKATAKGTKAGSDKAKVTKGGKKTEAAPTKTEEVETGRRRSTRGKK